MSVLEFDPDKFINCEFEHQTFMSLLTFADQARILAIRGPSGTGKSHLLRSFAYQCRIANPRRIPVCLLSLDQPGDAVLSLVQEMARQLTALGLDFPTFKRLESARVAKDFSPFRASVYLEGAIFKDANDVRISGTMINPERVETITISAERVEFTEDQVSLAQDVIVNAFFDDLHSCASQRPIVVLFDTYERSRPEVRAWINEYFLERLFFDLDRRPSHLVAVITGQDVPSFRQLWSSDLCEATVRGVPSLSLWDRHHIETCVHVHELTLDSATMDAFHQTVISMSLTPAVIVNMIQTSLSRSGRA